MLQALAIRGRQLQQARGAFPGRVRAEALDEEELPAHCPGCIQDLEGEDEQVEQYRKSVLDGHSKLGAVIADRSP